MSLSRKAINFDLSTKALKKHFGENTAQAYANIKEFMLENGFEHRQYSGYASKEVMDDKQIIDLTENIAEKFTWLSSCIQEFDVTDIGEQYSLSHIFKKSISIDKTLEKAPTKENPQKDFFKKLSKEQLERIRQKSKQKSNEQKPENNKDKGFEREF